ncbi:PTS sugar transporter subunit IIA [Exiguobacterium sp. 17-1]|nr:PTS sugar transporter subunit IIA [Exiguobacterium sp. 17-1]
MMATAMKLEKEMVLLNQHFSTDEEAIEAAGALLVNHGYVRPNYIESMKTRHRLSTVYIGNHVAIPHGTEEAKEEVLKTGLSILQVPNGVSFGTEQAKLIIGIAGIGDEHLELLSHIAIICSDEDNVERLVEAETAEEMIQLLSVEV